MLNKDQVREIRSMQERGWSMKEIAHKLCIRVSEVEEVLVKPPTL